VGGTMTASGEWRSLVSAPALGLARTERCAHLRILRCFMSETHRVMRVTADAGLSDAHGPMMTVRSVWYWILGVGLVSDHRPLGPRRQPAR
jgi:hypothetical protein